MAQSATSNRIAAVRPRTVPKGWSGSRRTLLQILNEDGVLDPGQAARAVALQRRQNLRIADILLSRGWVSEAELTSALSRQYGALPLNLGKIPPDPRLLDEMGVLKCLKAGAVPVQQLGGATIIATSRPEAFDALRSELPESFGDPIMALCTESELHQALWKVRGSWFSRRAETRVAERESCRFWYQDRPGRILIAILLVLSAAAAFEPKLVILALTLWALATLLATTVLKACAAWVAWRNDESDIHPPPERSPDVRLPVVSVLVPLFHEADIAPRLVRRLSRLTYPRELLDVCLITEEEDETTREMLSRATLPSWMRVINVPRGSLKTKPRALNFALDFCRGSIIGIWDAEDAPDPSQIHTIVRRFHEADPEVVCLQGVLDFYNSSTNWFSRVFTIEYAGWFRFVLPGLAKLGLVVPLGGTTVFFRREALDWLGAWDAHNVTEDADLGLRLARHGFRTELVPTVTGEEANCRLWPWVRQRSRWIKGYAMTWSAHMRNPRLLWRQLGPLRFVGVQILFAGTLSQFILAPLMWSFWLFLFGLPHPLSGVISPGAGAAIGALFLATELVNLAIGVAGSSRAGKSWLWPWVPTLHVYYPLASFAAYKALFEMIAKPFYWDKTCHGITDQDETACYSSDP